MAQVLTWLFADGSSSVAGEDAAGLPQDMSVSSLQARPLHHLQRFCPTCTQTPRCSRLCVTNWADGGSVVRAGGLLDSLHSTDVTQASSGISRLQDALEAIDDIEDGFTDAADASMLPQHPSPVDDLADW